MVVSLSISNFEMAMIKNQYIKFLTRIIIVILVLIIADQLIGRTLRHLYFSQVAGEYYRATYTIDSTKADILVFGSSRASHHYVPEIFEEKLKMSIYNTGRDGNYLLYNYAAFLAVTKRYTPKLVIFDINPIELYYREADYEGLSTLLPYYNDHPELKEIIELRGPFENYKLYSATYPFNSQLIYIGIGNLEVSKTKYGSHKGYLPLYGKMKSEPANNSLTETTGTIDTNKVNALTDISTYCKKNKIRLAFTYSPIFNNPTEGIASKIIADIAMANQDKYFNFSNDSIFDNHPEYFKDNVHLNNDGAKIFSKIISVNITNSKFDSIPMNSLHF